MKILLATGDHPRHQHLKNLLWEQDLLDAVIIEKREKFIPKPEKELSSELKDLFRQHFEKREKAENEIFSENTFSEKFTGRPELLQIQPGEMNSPKAIEFIKSNRPDVVITAGVGILSKEFLKAAPVEIWNIHGGLSPWYKGAITHFWPSYHLQPQFTGCTIHYINHKIDAGNIIHQTPAVLKNGDGLHQLSCRSLLLAFNELIHVLKIFKEKGRLTSSPQRSTGKLWLKNDWQPHHLKLIYDVYDDKIVDLYLNKYLPQTLPTLIRQDFEQP